MIQQDHLQVFDLTLKTQSPLFVGSGRKIGKREYIYSPNQGCVKILNMELFFDYIAPARSGAAIREVHAQLQQ